MTRLGQRGSIGSMTAEQERYLVRVEAALEDFHAGRMSLEELRAYLRRVSWSVPSEGGS